MINIFLDDIRNPASIYPNENLEWYIVRSYDEFAFLLNAIDINNISIISFDHDLGESKNNSEYTGYDCIKLLCDHCLMKNM